MSSSTFTPSTAIDPSKEKDWQASLGMLDWDSTSIVFTKRTLVEFLKYTGTTVDTNLSNISKLPRYAKFGKIGASSGATSSQGVPEAEAASTTADDNDTFVPTRRVRAPPGGKHTDIFSYGEGDDALATAPPKIPEVTSNSSPETTAQAQSVQYAPPQFEPLPEIKPSRRVRTGPGGKDSIGSLWDDPTPDEFKPSRRVRQGPGGEDSVSGIF